MKVIYFIIVALIICLFLIYLFEGPSKYQKSIYNNDNFILAEGDSYYSKKLNFNNNFIVFSNFTGSYTILRFDIEDNNILTFNINSNKIGKLKIIVIKNNSIYKTILADKEEIKVSTELDKGTYTIKIVGLYSYGNLKYDFIN